MMNTTDRVMPVKVFIYSGKYFNIYSMNWHKIGPRYPTFLENHGPQMVKNN